MLTPPFFIFPGEMDGMTVLAALRTNGALALARAILTKTRARRGVAPTHPQARMADELERRLFPKNSPNLR
jgi:hypothetical protein